MTAADVALPEILPAGADSVLIRFALTPEPQAMAAAQTLAAELDGDAPEGAIEIAPALVSVMLRFDPERTTRADVTAALRARLAGFDLARVAPPEPTRRWTIPASFGGENGPQLGELATLAGMTPEAAVREICAAELRVLTIGFAPGQPYIGLLPEVWDIPRMSAVNPFVPAGSVVVAVRQIVMFGADSATGWRHAGRAAFRSFRPEREPPMPLRAGDAIRYAPVSPAELDALAAEPDDLGGAKLEILR